MFEVLSQLEREFLNKIFSKDYRNFCRGFEKNIFRRTTCIFSGFFNIFSEGFHCYKHAYLNNFGGLSKLSKWVLIFLEDYLIFFRGFKKTKKLKGLPELFCLIFDSREFSNSFFFN